MKAFAVLALCVATVAANNYGSGSVRMDNYGSARLDNYGSSYGAPTRNIAITSFERDIKGSLSDSTRFSTENGIVQQEDTQVIPGSGAMYDDGYGNLVKSDSSIVKSGSYSYTTPEGQQITTNWKAGPDGFQVQGDHLPREVPMPADHAQAHAEAYSRSSSSYGAPAFRSSYDAPAPQIRVQSYDAPAVRVQSYNAPAVRLQTYEAPALRAAY